MHNGLTVRDVVLVSIRIKEKVGRVHDPDTIVSMSERGNHVQPVEEGLMEVIFPIAIGIFMDSDLVTTCEFLMGGAGKWRRGWHLVKDLAEVFVPSEYFESCRIGILYILHDPEPPAFVEVHEERLPDLGLTENGLHGQSSAGLKQIEGLLGGRGLALVIGPGIRILVPIKVLRDRG